MRQDRGKPNPFPHPVISFLSSSAEPRRSGCPESPRLSSKKPELADDCFSHPTVTWGPGHTLWPVVGCQGGLYIEVGKAVQPAHLAPQVALGSCLLSPSTGLGPAEGEFQPGLLPPCLSPPLLG